MRWKTLLVLAMAILGLAACGDDGSSDSGSPSAEDARQVVTEMIAAYQDGPDWAAVCDLSDQRALDSITEATGQDDCPAAYEFIEQNQSDLVQGQKNPVDDFAALLDSYEVGEAELTDEGATVTLEGDSPATSRLVVEDGEFKVSELFVTPDASTPGSFSAPEESGD